MCVRVGQEVLVAGPVSIWVIASGDAVFFVFKLFGVHRDLHSFPTRRSSDLFYCFKGKQNFSGPFRALVAGRSEEHTSELQSRPHLVCRLLLEKKKRAPRLPGPPYAIPSATCSSCAVSSALKISSPCRDRPG